MKVITAFVFILLSSCGQSSPPCSAMCQGCCNSYDVCESGMDNTACGSFGAACSDCAAASAVGVNKFTCQRNVAQVYECKLVP